MRKSIKKGKTLLKPCKTTVFDLLEYLVLAGVFVILCYFLAEYVVYNLDSDKSSELILGKMLAEEGGICSPNWYYSTELRVLNTQLIWAPLFALGLSWHAVRVTGSIIMYVLLVLGLWFYCRQAGMKKSFPYIAAVMLLPLSVKYFDILLLGAYYIPHVLISFVALGLFFAQAKTDQVKKAVLCFAANMLLAVIACMGGLRQLLILYIPLVLAAALNLSFHERSKTAVTMLWSSFALLLGGGAGYLINSGYLAQKYLFKSYEKVSFDSFSLAGLEKVLNNLLSCFSYEKGGALVSMGTLFNACALLLVLLSVYAVICILKWKENYSAAVVFTGYFYLSCLIAHVLLYSLTKMAMHVNYMIPIAVLAILVIFAAFRESESFGRYSRVISALLLAVVLASSVLRYDDMRKQDHTVNLRAVEEKLLEQGYTQGYASFWNGNILTELSEGKIQVWHWKDQDNPEPDAAVIDPLYRWLQPVAHLNAPPEGKLFLCFSEEEYEKYSMPQNLPAGNILFRTQYYDRLGTPNYIVFGFDSYEELAKQLPN